MRKQEHSIAINSRERKLVRLSIWMRSSLLRWSILTWPNLTSQPNIWELYKGMRSSLLRKPN
jgi:hypothetical protein